jgi:UDP-glucose-4-epimerase GalE
VPKVLVIGGAGYIGSHCCKAVAAQGFEPVVVDDFSSGHRDFVRWGPVEELNALDLDKLRAVVERHKPVAAMHFAAFSQVGESVAFPEKYYRNNIVGGLNIAKCLVETGVGCLVFSSTAAVYGDPTSLPITELTPQVPINPYGRSKKIVETILSDIGDANGLRSISLRYFNACGADVDGDIGEDHDPETHLIPRIIYKAMGKDFPLKVFGNDYPTPDGTALRDYIHVTDLAQAHVLALLHLLDGGGSASMNVGIGEAYSVFDVIESVRRVTKSQIDFDLSDRRAGDPAILLADTQKIKSTLGFEANCSGLDTIVESAYKWHRTRHA